MLPGPLEVIETVPWYNPGASPLGFTVTVTVDGVEVALLATISQLGPPEVVALA